MFSSTSTSKAAWLVTAAAFLAVLVGAYIAFIALVRPDHINETKAPSIYIENSITIEDYIFENRDIPCVIAGTSMSKVLDHGQIIDKTIFTNIAFWGATPVMGLHLVKRGPRTPNVIMIEVGLGMMNTDDNLELIDSVFTSYSYWFKKTVPAFRTRYQPGTVLLSYLKYRTMPPLQLKKTEASLASRDPKIYAVIMEMLRKKYGTVPQSSIDSRLNEISRMVRGLEQSGITIIFFEMPLSRELARIPTYVYLMNRARELFPSDRYQWIPRPDEAGYETSDGIHLIWSSAIKYYDYMSRQPTIRELIESRNPTHR